MTKRPAMSNFIINISMLIDNKEKDSISIPQKSTSKAKIQNKLGPCVLVVDLLRITVFDSNFRQVIFNDFVMLSFNDCVALLVF